MHLRSWGCGQGFRRHGSCQAASSQVSRESPHLAWVPRKTLGELPPPCPQDLPGVGSPPCSPHPKPFLTDGRLKMDENNPTSFTALFLAPS